MSFRRLLLIALAVAINYLTVLPADAASSEEAEKPVLAFYYPWYRTVEHSGHCSWNFGPDEYEERDADCANNHYSPHTPARGLYDSMDPAVVRPRA